MKAPDANAILLVHGKDGLRKSFDAAFTNGAALDCETQDIPDPARARARLDAFSERLSRQGAKLRDQAAANADLEHIASMSMLEYERCREAEAKRLGVRVSALDDERRKRQQGQRKEPAGLLEAPEPWATTVDGKALASEIEAMIGRYVVLPEHAGCAIALWVIMAHALDCFEIAPVLAIESPEKRCGKTTLLSLLQPLVPKPLTAANMTPAAVFRSVEAYKPTLLIDEADTFLTSDNPELVGVLNSGHTKASAFVVRVVGDNHDVKPFATWCPKVIALIGELPPTLQDRSIAVRMRRRQKGETVERRRGDRLAPLHSLCRKAARWAADHAEALKATDPEVPLQLDDRAADNWRPLISIAEFIGSKWPAEVRKASLVLSGSRADDDETGGVRLLADCREVFGRSEWLTPTDLVERLIALPEAPWSEWRNGRPIITRGVANLLKPFGIKSGKGREAGEDNKRRYYRNAFSDAWSRYLVEQIDALPCGTP
jgi:putative DNA primase/helicase